VLVYVYGPPAVGKLTVARRVHELTGFRLFHNHLTVNAIAPIFDFATAPFVDVVRRLRLDVFATAARTGTDVIFTNNTMWSGESNADAFLAFTRQAAAVVADAGGSTTFVRLTAPIDVLCERVDGDDRVAMQKLVNADRLRVQVGGYDPPALEADDLVIDTSVTSVEDAAHQIAAAIR
jgi:cytidylate kinase